MRSANNQTPLYTILHSSCYPGYRFLVSKLFDVTENSQLTDMYEHKPIRIPYGKGIVGYVAESGEIVNIPDAYQVPIL